MTARTREALTSCLLLLVIIAAFAIGGTLDYATTTLGTGFQP